jgi:hypothetical protein
VSSHRNESLCICILKEIIKSKDLFNIFSFVIKSLPRLTNCVIEVSGQPTVALLHSTGVPLSSTVVTVQPAVVSVQ